ncbi:hypothetical protein D3C80_1343920 [compost metagenome]
MNGVQNRHAVDIIVQLGTDSGQSAYLIIVRPVQHGIILIAHVLGCRIGALLNILKIGIQLFVQLNKQLLLVIRGIIGNFL